MSYSKKVASNTVIQLIGRIISTGLSFITVALLTRRLGVNGFGDYSTVFAYLGVFMVITDLGFFYQLVKKLSSDDKDGLEYASNLISMRTIIALIILSISVVIVQFFPYTNGIKTAVQVGAISFVFLAVQNTIFGIFQVAYKMQWPMISDLLTRSITLIFIAYFTSHQANIAWIMSSYIAGNGIGTFFIILMARRIIPFTFRINLSLWKSIFVDSLPFAATIIFSYLYGKVDILMLSILKGSADVGIYATAVKVIDVILIFPSIFISTILPIYSRYYKNNDFRLEKVIQKTFDLLSLGMFPVIIGVFVLSSPIIRLIGGSAFVNTSTLVFAGHQATSVTALSILVFAAALAFINPAFNYLLVAMGKQYKLVWPVVFFLFFNVGLNYFFIPRYSYVGAALSTVLTEIIFMITIVWLVKKELKFHLSLSRFFRSLAAGIIMGVVLYFTNLSLLAMIIVGGLIYLLSAYLLGAARPELIDLFFKKDNLLNSGDE